MSVPADFNTGFMAMSLAKNPWWKNYPNDDVSEEEKTHARRFVDGYVAALQCFRESVCTECGVPLTFDDGWLDAAPYCRKCIAYWTDPSKNFTAHSMPPKVSFYPWRKK